jgi:hypothetical protein
LRSSIRSVLVPQLSNCGYFVHHPRTARLDCTLIIASELRPEPGSWVARVCDYI